MSYTISSEVAECLSCGDAPEGYAILENEYVESRRWFEVWRVVFTSPNLGMFALYYQVPATECQEVEPFDEIVSVIPVVPTPRTIIEYVEEHSV